MNINAQLAKIILQKLKSKLFLCLVLLTFLAGQGFSQSVSIRIGLSKASPNYVNWLKRSNALVITVNLFLMPVDSALEELGRCNGLLVTGGEDVYPGLYGKETDTARCTEMNRHRDSLEIALVSQAIDAKMPVFAVCRGLQLVNVFLKGTLVIDIPEDIGTSVIHQSDDYLHCFHTVSVPAKSQLSSLCRCDSALVTSNHHQAIDRLSPLLRAGAFAGDGLPESIEWENPAGRSFLLGVQWHPERMEKSNPLSGALADEFIRQASLYAESINKNNR
jgi:putative glutamine amidotransferase